MATNYNMPPIDGSTRSNVLGSYLLVCSKVFNDGVCLWSVVCLEQKQRKEFMREEEGSERTQPEKHDWREYVVKSSKRESYLYETACRPSFLSRQYTSMLLRHFLLLMVRFPRTHINRTQESEIPYPCYSATR